TAGASELLIPVGSRGIALNGAYTSGFTGVDAIYWNPAGLAGTGQSAEAMISHMTYIADMGINYGVVAAKFGAVGYFGVSLKSLDFGDAIVETTVENPDGTGRTFSPTYFTLGLTFSRQMTDRILFGTTGKIISERFLDAGATGVAFDFGLQYATGVKGFKLGVALRNFGPRMRISGTSMEYKVQIPGTESGSRTENLRIATSNFELPSTFELGASYVLDIAENNSVTVMGMFQNNSFSFDAYNLAAEYSFNNKFFLRGSYALAFREGLRNKSDGFTSGSEDFLFGPALGAGFNLGLGQNVTMKLDYAYRTTEFFDDSQVFTVTFGF
ncbi:MAG: PorV/PorQ family protein, partial [candidate division KSB1 bacterium]|nr:PorV/PorQ family protein [candidate division KSB1 bacterium]